MFNFKKVVALMLATTMVMGSSLVAFAGEDNTAGGSGTSSGHLPLDVFSVTVPAETTTAGFFNYTVDPERIINKMGDAAKLKDGTDVTANEDGVYFKTTTGFGSTSQPLTLSVKNYIDADITATVELTAGADDIAVVNDVSAATEAALELKLQFGDGESKVTAPVSVAEGATASLTIEGQPDNYDVVLDGGAYKLDPKSSATWATAPIVFSGKTTSAYEITGANTTPAIGVTWSVTKHEDAPANAAPSIATTSYNMVAGTPEVVSYSLGRGELVADGIASVIWVEGAPNKNLYTDATFITKNEPENTFTLTATSINNMIAGAADSQTIRVTFTDDTVINLTFNDPE